MFTLREIFSSFVWTFVVRPSSSDDLGRFFWCSPLSWLSPDLLFAVMKFTISHEWHFFGLFLTPGPLSHVSFADTGTDPRPPPPLWRDIFNFEKNKLIMAFSVEKCHFSFKRQFWKREKCHVTFKLTPFPPPPCVIWWHFRKCHVWFEWPQIHTVTEFGIFRNWGNNFTSR